MPLHHFICTLGVPRVLSQLTFMPTSLKANYSSTGCWVSVTQYKSSTASQSFIYTSHLTFGMPLQYFTCTLGVPWDLGQHTLTPAPLQADSSNRGWWVSVISMRT